MRNRSRWVVDASVAAKWYLRDDEDLLEKADEVRVRFESGSAFAVCPHVARHELANAVAVAYRGGRISQERATASLSDFLATGLSYDGDSDWLIRGAATVAMDLPVFVNDAIYIALAASLGYEFVTDDRRLYDKVANRFPFVRWLGDLPVA